MALIELNSRKQFQIWPLVLITVAVLFNPVLPIHLNRASWLYLDLAAAAVFIGHFVLVRRSSV